MGAVGQWHRSKAMEGNALFPQRFNLPDRGDSPVDFDDPSSLSLSVRLRNQIASPHDRTAGVLASLWRHSRLLWQFARRDLETRHRGSTLGAAWSVLNPLLTLLLYVLVFGYIFGGHFPEDPINTKMSYALGVFLGLSLFHFLAEVLALAPMAVVNAPNLVKRVVFPLPILPAATVGSALFHLLVSLTLVCAMALGWGVMDWTRLWALPVLLAPLVIATFGMSLALSSLGVFIRDFTQVIQFTTMALMFGSAIFYSTTAIPAPAWSIMRFNPLLRVVHDARTYLLWEGDLNLRSLAYVYTCAGIILWVGCWCFRRLQSGFADQI